MSFITRLWYGCGIAVCSLGCAQPGFELSKVIDRQDVVPGSTAPFAVIRDTSFDGTHVAFGGSAAGNAQSGVYRWSAATGTQSVAVDGQTAPGGDGTQFADFSAYQGIPSVHNGQIVFFSRLSNGKAALFSGTMGGTLTRVASVSTGLPGAGSDRRVPESLAAGGRPGDVPCRCRQ